MFLKIIICGHDKLKSEVLNDKLKKTIILTFYFFVIEFFPKTHC